MPISQIEDLALIQPDWQVTPKVKAFTTTRLTGTSQGKYRSFNLATHVNDEHKSVMKNRQKLQSVLQLPSEPFWLDQQHTNKAIAFSEGGATPIADAAWTQTPGQVLTVMTADCLPILMVNEEETLVAAIHAGWRGLADGIIENTLAQLPVVASSLKAWIGPAISQQFFEVGGEVLDTFVEKRVHLIDCFSQSEKDATKYFADLPSLADFILREAGVKQAFLSGLCSYEQDELFYSYRRDGQTGRMASLIWLTP